MNVIILSSFKNVSAELLLCALLYFSLDDGISRASLLLLVVARWCIVAPHLVSVVSFTASFARILMKDK